MPPATRCMTSLVIALCAMVCGGQTCTDMELFGHAKRDLLQSFLKLENGIPSHDTFSWVLGQLDPEAFRGWWRWTARPCGVLTTGPKGARLCIWSAPRPRSKG